MGLDMKGLGHDMDAPKRSRDSSKTAPNGSKLVAKLVAESWRRVLVPGMW